MNRGGVIAPYLSIGAGAVRDKLIPEDVSRMTSQPKRAWACSSSSGRTVPARASCLCVRTSKRALTTRAAISTWLITLATLGLQFGFGGRGNPPPPPPPPPRRHHRLPLHRRRRPRRPPPPEPDKYNLEPKGSVVLEGVTFAFNKADLTANSRPVLDDVAASLQKHPLLKVEIQGHTDSTGPADYNLKLSDRRAASVRDYLIEQGCIRGALDVQGLRTHAADRHQQDRQGALTTAGWSCTRSKTRRM
jgi:outer membrane protein OmpA-like peptidoglycan-associated protein